MTSLLANIRDLARAIWIAATDSTRDPITCGVCKSKRCTHFQPEEEQ